MTTTKKISPDIWAEMKTAYQMGEGLRAIARRFNYDAANLSRRLKKEGVVQGQLKEVIEQKITTAIDSAKVIDEPIQQITTPQQHKVVSKILNKKLERLTVANEIAELALNLNQNLLTEVYNRANPANRGKSDYYPPHEAIALLRGLGMSYDKLITLLGLKPNDADDPDEPTQLSIELIG